MAAVLGLGLVQMTKQHWMTLLLRASCLILNTVFKEGKINMGNLTIPPSVSVE